MHLTWSLLSYISLPEKRPKQSAGIYEWLAVAVVSQSISGVFTSSFRKIPVALHLGKDKYFFHYIWEDIHKIGENKAIFGLGMPPVTGGNWSNKITDSQAKLPRTNLGKAEKIVCLAMPTQGFTWWVGRSPFFFFLTVMMQQNSAKNKPIFSGRYDVLRAELTWWGTSRLGHSFRGALIPVYQSFRLKILPKISQFYGKVQYI